ncbi:hypothetical protein SAMN06298216_3462 [Spirosomataceae bacterium TFI 002]|nr:hypothetical protein SAMN06298216_3462 [Spirosomataceae bacterium TFI 002]
MEFLNELEPFLKIFWYVAIPTSLIFVIQTILTFSGMGASDGIDADFDGDFNGEDTPFQIFSLRNLINFLLGFSWTGISLYHSISNEFALIGISFIVGFLFVFLFFVVINQVQKLAEDNTFKIQNVVGKTGEVYLNIPAEKNGKGKVMVSVNGAYHELDAVTEGKALKPHSLVKIKSLESGNLLIVESI